MTGTEYEALVATLGENEKAILAETRQLGNATVSMLRPVTRGPKTGKPMAYGLTRELARLQEVGLLRHVARSAPAQFVVVPPAQVEVAAKEYTLKKRRAKKRRGPRQRLAELRTYEHGDYSDFYRVHKRVIELSEYLSHHLSRMAFWEAAPKDDLARVVGELGDLLSAIDEALVCLKGRADDDELLATIAKLEATNGRTAAEVANARSLANRLRAQYDQRVGVID